MQIIVDHVGGVRYVYGETIDIATLGPPTITRGSHVEPDQDGRWYANLSPVDGPLLGPFDRRSDALKAEIKWLETNWLSSEPAT